MHLLLTDRLTCPRCGPDFGLILLAREIRNRRIIHGEFGCANCRETYPVEEGFADLRRPPRRPLEDVQGQEAGVEGRRLPEPGSETEEYEGMRVAALLGITEGPGTVLLKGPDSALAGVVARLVEGVEVVGVGPSQRSHPQEEGVSRMVAGPDFPFFSGTLRAVLLSDAVEVREVKEAVRVLGPNGRIVLTKASPLFREYLEGEGLKIVLDEDGVLVGQREGYGAQQLVTLRGL